jgi:hypothetical protein
MTAHCRHLLYCNKTKTEEGDSSVAFFITKKKNLCCNKTKTESNGNFAFCVAAKRKQKAIAFYTTIKKSDGNVIAIASFVATKPKQKVTTTTLQQKKKKKRLAATKKATTTMLQQKEKKACYSK